MKSFKYLSLVIIAISLGLTSCWELDDIDGNGKIVHEFRSVSGFDGVSSEGDYDVFITESASSDYEVEVITDENLISYVSTRVSGNTLIISNTSRHSIKGSARITVYIKTPYVEYINISGSGTMTCDNVNHDSMEANISGSGYISLYGLNTKNISARIAGSGEIEMRGYSKTANFEIMGSGQIRGYSNHGRLETDTCSVNISGSGEAHVYVNNQLNAYIAGSGQIFYRGNPVLHTVTSGSGHIYRD